MSEGVNGQYDNIYMLGVKPGTTWEEETEDGFISLIPLSSDKLDSISLEADLVEELTKFKVYEVPPDLEKFKITNETKEVKFYIVLRKEKVVE